MIANRGSCFSIASVNIDGKFIQNLLISYISRINTDKLVCPISETNCELCPKNRTNKERDCPKDRTNSDLGCLRNIKCKDYVGTYEFILKSEDDVDFAFEFFKQVYEEKTEE